MRLARPRAAVLLSGAIAMLAAVSAYAQAPPYPPPPVAAPPPASPEAADIASCLCLHQAIDALGATMSSQRQAYDEIQGELARLDQQLQQERARMDVNDPQSVSRFRQLLERRDGLFRRSTGQVASDLSVSVGRYNADVNEYNARCAGRPRDPVLLGRVQASLTCPAPP